MLTPYHILSEKPETEISQYLRLVFISEGHWILPNIIKELEKISSCILIWSLNHMINDAYVCGGGGGVNENRQYVEY